MSGTGKADEEVTIVYPTAVSADERDREKKTKT